MSKRTEPGASPTMVRADDHAAAPPGDSVLRIVGGPDAGKWIPVPAQTFVIGTARGCDLQLADPLASRRHLEASWTGTGLRIRDLGSSNGTYYLGSRVTEAVIPHGGVVAIGDTRIALLPALENLDLPAHPDAVFGSLVGESTVMRRLFTAVERVATSDVTVLLLGETGTGKGALAREIHERSARARHPFVTVDCGAIAPNLVESELFGHEKGAFTGAAGQHQGAFERANGGTIFLDEVGELPLAVQPKLLRVLEERTVQRLGGTAPLPVDVRFIAATHRDLADQVKKGTFRADLYYRLAVAALRAPALRERPDDVPTLVRHIVARAPAASRIEPRPETIALLQRHEWPGNVRELRNFVERALAFGDERLLQVGAATTGDPSEIRVSGAFAELPFKKAKQAVIESFEKQYLQALLERFDHNYSKAAKKAGLDRNHLATLAARYGLTR